ncbi:hypothetical protein FXO37_25700 [Capsicum annuum]|nr:hypothetical protein FXO37_25700 [Capsicum annuum]
MNDGQFLFELPSRKVTEHIQSGEWIWKKMRLKLEWWNPTTGCWMEEIRRDWVETPVTVRLEKEKPEEESIDPVDNEKLETLNLVEKEVANLKVGHVGKAKSGGN